MTISNLKADDDGAITFTGTAEMPGELVVFEARVNPYELAALVAAARSRERLAAADGPVNVRVTGVGGA